MKISPLEGNRLYPALSGFALREMILARPLDAAVQIHKSLIVCWSVFMEGDM
jgi:hypothetical protein